MSVMSLKTTHRNCRTTCPTELFYGCYWYSVFIMKWRSLEHFSDDSVAVTALPTAFANSKVRTICSKAATLDQNRQDFTSTFEDMITKLKAAESSASVNDKLNGYKSQLIRVNDLNDSLTAIINFFNGDDVTGQNCIQNLVDLTKLLNASTDQAYIDETSQLLTSAEDSMKTVYSLSNKLETIRNYLINFLNISNRTLSYARLLCLKGQVLDPTLQSLALSVNTKLQAFVTALENWCAQMATINPQPACTIGTISTSTMTGTVSTSSLTGNASLITLVTGTTSSPASNVSSSVAKGACPVTAMSYDSTKQEYRIASHPDIKDWGVENTMWQADGGFVPDYIAQKMGLTNRCKSLDDFNIIDHKDIVNYTPNANYSKMKTAAQALQERAKKCEAAFSKQSCNCKETFANGSLTSSSPTTSSSTSPDDLTLTCPTNSSPLSSYGIKDHKDYKRFVKNYTPNCKLPSVCKTYPIRDNVAIGDYVLKSSLPSSLTVQPLEQHPDFNTYNQSWISKADLQAKTASQNAESICSAKLKQYSGKDQCGNPAPCKALKDYALQDHPDFPEYTREWKNVVSKFAAKDANGNFVKCQAPSTVQKIKNDMKADCAKSLTALKARYAPLSAQNQTSSSDTHSNNPDMSKYILRSSMPDLVDRNRCELDKSELARAYEKKMNALSSGKPATLRPDMTKYILRSDVLPCPTKDEIRANVGNYLSSTQMQDMCSKAGFSQAKSDTCESHFVHPSNVSFTEHFDDSSPEGKTKATPSVYDDKNDPSQQEPIVKPYPQPHDKFSGQYDIMLHRDYKYDDPFHGHMPKQECYSTYAMVKDGKPYPCKHTTGDIKKHPDFEKTVLEYGAVKDRCGNLLKPPQCPSLKKDICGDWVHTTDELSCSDKAKFEAQLLKEKLKFNIILRKYRELSSRSPQNPSRDSANQLDDLREQLSKMQVAINSQEENKEQSTEIDEVSKTPPRERQSRAAAKDVPTKIIQTPFPSAMATTTHLRRHVDMDKVAALRDYTSLPSNTNRNQVMYEYVQPLAAARQSQTGWTYFTNETPHNDTQGG